MSEQDLERIATIMTGLINADDRALIARLAMRDMVATLVRADRARVVLAEATAMQARQKPTAG